MDINKSGKGGKPLGQASQLFKYHD